MKLTDIEYQAAAGSDDPSILIGQGHCGLVVAERCLFPASPAVIVVIPIFIVTQYRPGAVDQ